MFIVSSLTYGKDIKDGYFNKIQFLWVSPIKTCMQTNRLYISTEVFIEDYVISLPLKFSTFYQITLKLLFVIHNATFEEEGLYKLQLNSVG